MVKYLSFHNSSFDLKNTFQCKWQGQSVTYPKISLGRSLSQVLPEFEPFNSGSITFVSNSTSFGPGF